MWSITFYNFYGHHPVYLYKALDTMSHKIILTLDVEQNHGVSLEQAKDL